MNKIICGESLTELEKLATDSIDLVVTSPPYFQQRKYYDQQGTKKTPWHETKEIGWELDSRMYIRQLGFVFKECVRIIRPTGSIVWNMGDVYCEKSLQLIPHRFAFHVMAIYEVKLINEITWVKSNPTPRQYNKRLVNATEPFFHFVKSDNYYYNRDAFFQDNEPIKPNTSPKKGQKYVVQIQNSQLSPEEKAKALSDLKEIISEVREGKISDFRMKIRGIHKKAFGGQQGGRNNKIDKQGFTIIRFTGKKMKRDVIETAVANTKNIDHPAVFPLKVILELVQLLSEENNVILDPFCGSGQVCIAAKSLNRQYLGIDLNSDYCDLTKKRLLDLPKNEK